MRAFLIGTVVLATALTAGCAGRIANPAPVATPYDRYYSCADIRAEQVTIGERVGVMAMRADEAHRKDTELAMRSAIWWPGFFAMHDSAVDSAKAPQVVEVESLKSRYAHLNDMAAARNCTSSGTGA